jgi:nucleoside-diphosphate-sugar epimerase
MSVLVFGGTGFIGRRAIRRLVERGEDVVCMDINPGAAAFTGPAFPIEDRVKVVQGDVTQFEDVIKATMEAKPERVLNLAYLLGGGEGNPHFTMRLNILGMDNCFEAARLCGVKRVVYASSIAVSGQQRKFGDRLVNEDDSTYGTSQYAVHKIFNEFQAAQYIRSYGMSITGIRPANVTGPDKVRGSTDHVQCITLPAQGEPVRFPMKSLMRLPVHVEDVAEAFVRVTLADSTHYPIYNTGGTAISMGDLADLVRRFIPDAQISFDSEGGREESGNYLVDNSRLLQEFELEYMPYPARVLEIINDVRREQGMPLVRRR